MAFTQWYCPPSRPAELLQTLPRHAAGHRALVHGLALGARTAAAELVLLQGRGSLWRPIRDQRRHPDRRPARTTAVETAWLRYGMKQNAAQT